MAIIYKIDGSKTEVKPANGKKFSLEELQGFVGGYIERVPNAAKGKTYWANEEGLILGLPFNPWFGRCLVGDVVETVKGEF